MSQLNEPPYVKLFMGLIYNQAESENTALKKLSAELGEIDYQSPETHFDHSTYYKDEMGEGLLRKLITFKKLIPREQIVGVKAFTNKLEEVFSYEDRRSINIDPGYIAYEHVILSTGKGYSHRPYLGSGVYADLTLIYMNDEYKTLNWTYPDYGTKEMRALFKHLRQQYAGQLAEESNI
ncbi:MAG: DUF4416 family protein [Thermodesulfobacteriota bacterium]